MIIDIICILIVLYFYYRWFQRPLNEVYFLFMFIYQGFWVLCSLVFLENTSVYMIETDRSAYRVYSVPIYLLFHISSIFIFIISYKTFTKNYTVTLPKISTSQQIKFLRIFFFIVYTILFVNLVLSPIPLFVAGVDEDILSRFDFWKNSRFPFLSIFGETAAILIVIASIVFLQRKKEGFFYFCLYTFYLVLLGHKFGSIVSIVFIFFIPYVLTNANIFLRINLKMILIGLLVSIVSVYITFLNYSNFNPYSNLEESQTPFLAILYRAFALQAQLVWISIEQNIYLDKASTLFFSDLYYGMHNLMNKYTLMTLDVGNYKGSQLTNGYPSILIEIFPPLIAFIVNLVFYLIFSYVIFLLYVSLKKTNYFFYILLYYCMSFALNFLSMGNMSTLTVVFIIVILSFFLLRQKKYDY